MKKKYYAVVVVTLFIFIFVVGALQISKAHQDGNKDALNQASLHPEVYGNIVHFKLQGKGSREARAHLLKGAWQWMQDHSKEPIMLDITSDSYGAYYSITFIVRDVIKKQGDK
jgi:hypothetical protein